MVVAPRSDRLMMVAAQKEGELTGETIREAAREKTDLSEEEFDRLLDARKMTEV